MKKILIIITTYNRRKMLLDLLRDIHDQEGDYKVELVILNDGSKESYMTVLAYLRKNFERRFTYIYDEHNLGKAGYWKRIKRLYEEVAKRDYNYVIQIPDDIRLVDHFFFQALNLFTAIPHDRRLCMSLHKEESRAHTGWTSLKTQEVVFGGMKLLRTGWMDMCYIASKKYFELLNHTIHPVPENWAGKEGKSSGVGMQISRRLVAKGCHFYQVKYSLIKAGVHASVMISTDIKP
jgi:glycosyltransferase involved in cell wall biosynthesis